MLKNNKIVYYCGVCTNPCYVFTGTVVGPNRCIRSDLDVSNKAEWVIVKSQKIDCNKSQGAHKP